MDRTVHEERPRRSLEALEGEVVLMHRLRLSKEFAARCRDRILDVFASLDLEPPRFQAREGNLPYIAGEFAHGGRTYRIEIYNENVVMHEGGRYYECYMRDEFQNEESLIRGFAIRLTRLLSGGPWEGPDEKSVFDRIVAFARKKVHR
jgi:hypothetical protein